MIYPYCDECGKIINNMRTAYKDETARALTFLYMKQTIINEFKNKKIGKFYFWFTTTIAEITGLPASFSVPNNICFCSKKCINQYNKKLSKKVKI